MPVNLGPKEVQNSVRVGFKRLHNFRQARLLFLKAYLGQYYDKDHGDIGVEPLNLIFNAIRVLLPQIVMSDPKFHLQSQFVAYKDYAELMGLAMDLNSKQLKIRDIYRLWMVDTIFSGLGILKTGLADSGTAIRFDEDENIDPGMVYTEHVEFDNFVFDPTNRGRIEESAWIGDRLRINRQFLLDSGEYNNDLIVKLPSIRSYNSRNRASDLSTRNVNQWELDEYEDEVEIVEVWMPRAQSIITVPAPMSSETGNSTEFPDFLRVHDYYGPDEGPYTFLSLTPPIPGNPMPVAPVGVWHDLHIMANRMVKKTLDQADRQKDIVFYRRASADDAQEALDAADGDAIAVDDPEGITTASFGGQQPGNIEMIGYLQVWFNMISGNPQGIGGQALDADSATEAQILQSNADVTLNDMRDLVYKASGEEGKKRLFYMHTDPLMEIPLSRRKTVQTENGPQPMDEQIILTPEARRGDFLDYTITVQPESMSRVDSQTRLFRSMEFAIKALPAAANVALIMMQLGMPFNIQVYIERLAKDSGIDWFDEVWYDPAFQQKWASYMQMGPQPDSSKGTIASAQPNGQPRTVGKVRTPTQQNNRQEQMGAAQSQSTMPSNQRY